MLQIIIIFLDELNTTSKCDDKGNNLITNSVKIDSNIVINSYNFNIL